MKRKIIIIVLAILLIFTWTLYTLRILHLRKTADTDIEEVIPVSGAPLSFWLSNREMGYSERLYISQLVLDWNDTHPDAHIQLKLFSELLFEDTLTTALQEGNPPDLFITHGNILNRLKENENFISRIADIPGELYPDGIQPELPGPIQKVITLSDSTIVYPIAYGYRRFGYVCGWYLPLEKREILESLAEDPFTTTDFIDLWHELAVSSEEGELRTVLGIDREALTDFFDMGLYRLESEDSDLLITQLKLFYYLIVKDPFITVIDDPDSLRNTLLDGTILIAATRSPALTNEIKVRGYSELIEGDPREANIPAWFPIAGTANTPQAFIKVLGIFKQSDDDNGLRTQSALQVGSYLADPLLLGQFHFLTHHDLPVYPDIFKQSFSEIVEPYEDAQNKYMTQYIRFNRLYFSKPDEAIPTPHYQKNLSRILLYLINDQIGIEQAAWLIKNIEVSETEKNLNHLLSKN